MEPPISTLPEYEYNSFARWIAKTTEAYFEKPEVKKRFEEWIKNRNGAKENA